MAYGNVKQIRRSVEDALRRIHAVSGGPADFTRKLQSPDFTVRARSTMAGFVHRFNRGGDLVLLFQLLSRSWRQYGSLGAHFVAGLGSDDADIGNALDTLIGEWRSWEGDFDRPEKNSHEGAFSYLLTSPRDGSCCKRWCMFLRWVGRRDEPDQKLDLGLWAEGGALVHTFPKGRVLRSDQLIIPLDTHTGRISQYLGLTGRKTLGWSAALEVTRSLRKCSKDDPTRYDFAMSRLGILDLCQKAFRVEICLKCDLLGVCRYAQRKARKKR